MDGIATLRVDDRSGVNASIIVGKMDMAAPVLPR